jgi:hypothetical protein
VRKAFLFAALLVSLATPCLARRIPVVAAYRAGQAQGSVLAVRGRAEIRPDVTYQGLDVDLVDENGRVVFIGFIPKLNVQAFPHAEALNGKMVVMYGVIEIYQGLPATQLLISDQLRPA